MAKRTCCIDGCDRRDHLRRNMCGMHYYRWYTHGDPLINLNPRGLPTLERFWLKVNQDGPIPGHAPHLGRCWLWLGRLNGDGYGGFNRTGQRSEPVHRVAYELLVGPIPEALHIDHLCRNRPCVNPAHLEPVAPGVNVLRGNGTGARNARMTHCKRGHEFTSDNTMISHGARVCRQCRNAQRARRRLEAQALVS